MYTTDKFSNRNASFNVFFSPKKHSLLKAIIVLRHQLPELLSRQLM